MFNRNYVTKGTVKIPLNQQVDKLILNFIQLPRIRYLKQRIASFL